MPKITPNLTPNHWSNAQAMEAAVFFVSVFRNSEITDVIRFGKADVAPAGASGGSAP